MHLEIHALHGFLGRPQDWDQILPDFQAIDLFNDICPFWEWAEKFNASVKTPGILLGYSLGGRLAMHALLNRPELWTGAILVSCHPGLQSPEEKKLRLQHEYRWAERFQSDPWDLLLQDWNQQSVFIGDQPKKREEQDFSRIALSKALQEWSLGQQEDLRERLGQLDLPIFWIAGEQDEKYATLTKEAHLKHPISKKWIAPNASHRVPWQQPNQFKFQILDFLRSLR